MQYVIKLAHSEDAHTAEIQEQMRFIKAVLEALEIPFDWNLNEPLSIEKKLDLKKLLLSYNINIINDTIGNVEVFVEKEIIAKWNKPIIKLIQDKSKKELFKEMNIHFWIIFEEGADEINNAK